MGPEIRANLVQEVARIYHALDNGLTPFSVFFPRAPTKAHKARDAARKEMVGIFAKVIQASCRCGVGSCAGSPRPSQPAPTHYGDSWLQGNACRVPPLPPFCPRACHLPPLSALSRILPPPSSRAARPPPAASVTTTFCR